MNKVTRTDVINIYKFILGRELENEQVIENYAGHYTFEECRSIFLNSDEFTQLYSQKRFDTPFIEYKVTKTDVINMYKFILGREPEDEQVIENYAGHCTFEECRSTFLNSDEFKQLYSQKSFDSPFIEYKTIETFEEYDEFIKECDKQPPSDLNKFFLEHRLDISAFIKLYPPPPPADPFSIEYAQWEENFAAFLSGKKYEEKNEGLHDIDIKQYAMQPIYLHYDFERYYKKQNEMLKLFQMMNPQKGGLLLEMGCGMGELLDMFGRYGLTVHGIDASNAQCEIARLRLCSQNIPAKIYCSSFYDLENLEEKYDIIIFEAAFHHCGKPMKLLEIIRKKLVGNGKLVFLNEPIANFKKPWGVVRNDGETIYQIRKRGWLELGYSMSFLTEALGRIGFVWDKVDESNNIFIATLK